MTPTDRIQSALNLHTPVPKRKNPLCTECGNPHPCMTVLILEGGLDDAEELNLQMLGACAEIFECADIWSSREWAEWSIDNEFGDQIARGSARDADAAKAVVETLVKDRWNARAAHAS